MDWRACSPPIESIWIDEDQFMEKMYGFQMNHMMNRKVQRSNTVMSRMSMKTQEKIEHTQILILNSDKPQLDNKTVIRLNLFPDSKNPIDFMPIGNQNQTVQNNIILKNETNLSGETKKPFRSVSLSDRIKRNIKNTFSINLLTGKLSNTNGSKKKIKFKISHPFCFQHISHGNEPTEHKDNQIKNCNMDVDSLLDQTTELGNDDNQHKLIRKESIGYDTVESQGTDADSNNSKYEPFSKFRTPKTDNTSSVFKSFSVNRTNGFDNQNKSYEKHYSSNSIRSSLLFELDREQHILSSPSTLVESVGQAK